MLLQNKRTVSVPGGSNTEHQYTYIYIYYLFLIAGQNFKVELIA